MKKMEAMTKGRGGAMEATEDKSRESMKGAHQRRWGEYGMIQAMKMRKLNHKTAQKAEIKELTQLSEATRKK